MHTSLDAVAVFIATALYPTYPLSAERQEDILYDTVNTLLFAEGQKADLYARLADGLTGGTGFGPAIPIIKRAIHACQYPG